MEITGGLSQVSVDGVTITGNGTPGSPLIGAGGAPPGWPVTWWTQPVTYEAQQIQFGGAAGNIVLLTGFAIAAPVRFNTVYLHVITDDPAGLYSVGIYNSAGALVCSSLPAAIGATGVFVFTQVGGPFTINPGRYYLGTTGNSGTAQFATASGPGVWNFFFNFTAIATASGVLPTTITTPANVVVDNSSANFALSI
jgi:hypothetical protein